jgi:hypothetical protein
VAVACSDFVSLLHLNCAGFRSISFVPIHTVWTEIKTGDFDSRMKLASASQSS